MIVIDKNRIGAAAQPFIIAELSGNHGGSLSKALSIVEAVARSGAHALKLQTYTADTMTLDISEREFVIDNPKSLWHGKRWAQCKPNRQRRSVPRSSSVAVYISRLTLETL